MRDTDTTEHDEARVTAATPQVPADQPGEVLVRYWASARAAVGAAQEHLPVPAGGQPLAELIGRVVAGRGPRVAQVVAICSVLLDEQAVHDAEEAVVRPGSTVDLLPPFAGG